jgi:hypothetical protein
MARKSTKGELIMRREFVQDLMLKGHTQTEISTIVSEKYGIKKRVVLEDIREVTKSWASKAEESRPLMKNKFLDRLELMFATALTAGNIKSALEIQKEINKISGLYQETQSETQAPQFITIKPRESLSVVPKAANEKPE